MHRGLLFLICAILLPFAFLSQSERLGEFDGEDYDISCMVDIPDIPFDSIGSELTVPVKMPSSDPAVSTTLNSNGRFGLLNHNNICYMSAFVTAAFNVHSFRRALFECEPENATTVMLAEVFAKLQTAKKAISTELCLMKALKREINWEFGGFEDNIELCGKILDMLPKSIQPVYTTSVRTNYYLEENQVLFKTKDVDQNFIMIMPTFRSISGAIESRFRSQVDYSIEQVDFHEYEGKIAPFSGKKKVFSSISEEFIINRPEIIIFGIGRKQFNAGFDVTPMELDFEIILPGLEEASEPVKYILQSFCYHVPGHYISYARDFTVNSDEGVWYQYNDSNVRVVNSQQDLQSLKQRANTGATLAFYVRADCVVTKVADSEPKIPERIMNIANLMLALEEIQERRKESFSQKNKQYYRSPPAPAPAPAHLIDSYSPKSLESIASIASAHRSSILNEDDDKRSKSLPSLTGKNFSENFPLGGGYF